MNTYAAVTCSQQEWALQQQASLAAIAAPTGNEGSRAHAMRQGFQQAGAQTCLLDAAGNVCASFGDGKDAPLVCLAHLDTVYDAAPPRDGVVSVHRNATLLRAPGIGDNSRGLAAMLLLARVLALADVRARLRRPVHLVATVAEEGEGNLRGARAWFDAAEHRGDAVHAAVAIDGPGDESIVHHAVGSHRMRVTMQGDGGHSWVHADAANPIHVLGEFIARVSRLSDARRRDAVVHVTRMQGGESLTGIPQRAWVDVDLRGTSAARIEQVTGELHRLVQQLTPPTLRADVTVLGDRPAGSLDDAHPLVHAARRATEAVGITPRSASASTDANIPLSRGIPAIAIGAGGCGGGAHTSDEWYDDATGARGLTRLLRLVLDLAVTA
jgi:tripeptide aminopeptidase